jgi:hypothetical protein
VEPVLDREHEAVGAGGDGEQQQGERHDVGHVVGLHGADEREAEALVGGESPTASCPRFAAGGREQHFNPGYILHIDEVTMQSVSGDGRSVTVSPALQYDHRGARDADTTRPC